VKKTTEAMHRAVGRAITELRRTMNWSQEDLAREIRKHGTRHGHWMEAPPVDLISKWEHGFRAPDAEHRAALARIAANEKSTEGLVPIFHASMATWNVVSKLAALDERQESEVGATRKEEK
jgi:transcriptional regulator with XRE-family HTH domain